MSVSSEVISNPRFQFLDNKWVTIHHQETGDKEVFRCSCCVSYEIEQRNGLHYHVHEYFLFILESSNRYYFIRYPEQREIVKRKVTEGCCVPRLSEIIPKIYECSITGSLPVPPKNIRSYPSEYKNALREIQSYICANFFKTALKITSVFEKTQRAYSDTSEEEESQLVYASDTNGNVKVVGKKQKNDPLSKPELDEMTPLSKELILTLRRALSVELQPPTFEQQEETPPRIRRSPKKTPSPDHRERTHEYSLTLPKREQGSTLNGLLLLGEPGFEKRGVLQRRPKRTSLKKERCNPDTPEPRRPQSHKPELISTGSTISSDGDQKINERPTN